MNYGTYRLSANQQKTYGIEEVSAVYEGNWPERVINHPENDILAGDRIISSLNPLFKIKLPDSEANRRYRATLTDDYSAEVSVETIDRRRAKERVRMQATIVDLANMAYELANYDHQNPAIKERMQADLLVLAEPDARAIDEDKKIASDGMLRAVLLLQGNGRNVPAIGEQQLERIKQRIARRDHRLYKQDKVSEARLQRLQGDAISDYAEKLTLNGLNDTYHAIAEDEARFLHHAWRRVTKPGNLTVNNAWYHREDPDSWTQLRLAQEIFEGMYPVIIRTMTRLSNETERTWSLDPEAAKEQYLMQLGALEDLVDIFGAIGGDYVALAHDTHEIIFAAEDLLMHNRFREVRHQALEGKYLLRYRTQPRSPAPEQWYSGLPDVKTGKEPVAVPQAVIDNPFIGLPGNEPF